jgi:hypothetical protein
MSPRGDFDSGRMTRPSGENRRSAPGADARELARRLLVGRVVNRWPPRPAAAEQPPDAGAHPDDDGDGPGRFFAVVIVHSSECPYLASKKLDLGCVVLNGAFTQFSALSVPHFAAFRL